MAWTYAASGGECDPEGFNSGPEPDPRLLDRLDVSWLPALVKPRLQRTIKAQEHVPSLARHSLDSIVFLTGGGLRTEPDRRGAVRIGFETWSRAVHACELLICLQERAGLVVIDDE